MAIGRWSAVLAIAMWAGCGSSVPPEFDQCTLEATLSASEGNPGDLVTATGGEFSVAYDTVVRVGGVDAEVVDVTRDDCNFCDLCRQSIEPPCDGCESCTACSESCATCVQVVAFVVPEVDPGPTSVVITNRFGTTEPIPFTVSPGEIDTDTGS